MLRSLSLQLRGEPETQLPLTREEDLIKTDDVLDLSESWRRGGGAALRCRLRHRQEGGHAADVPPAFGTVADPSPRAKGVCVSHQTPRKGPGSWVPGSPSTAQAGLCRPCAEGSPAPGSLPSM